MARWIPYCGLAILPLLAIFPFNWSEFSWVLHHGSDPMPPEIARQAKNIGRYAMLLRHILLIAIVLYLAAHQSIKLSEIGLSLQGWRGNFFIGFGFAFLPIGHQAIYRKLHPLPDNADEHLAAVSAADWIISQPFSVFAEELWIALCLVLLIRTGHSTVTAVMLTAVVFGALHFQYRFGMIGLTLYGAVSSFLFLWRGSLLPSCLVHYIRNLGSFYWARYASRRAN